MSTRVATFALMIAILALSGRAAFASSRDDEEAAFLRHVDKTETASVLTSNIPFYIGSKIALRCTIAAIVNVRLLVGQCEKAIEPVDLYVETATNDRRLGDAIRVLGIVDTPGSWTDINGHTIYYPFVRAVFVDALNDMKPYAR